MRKTTVLACMVALGGLASVPAFADCSADVKAASDAAMKVTDASQKAEAEKHIDAAKAELAKSNEKGCEMHISEANKVLKPSMKNP